MANLLARRALGAQSLAALFTGARRHGVCSRGASSPPPEEATAGLAHLRRRLAVWGEPLSAIAPTGVLWARDPRGHPLGVVAGSAGLLPGGFSLKESLPIIPSDGNARRWRADPLGDGRRA
jgi:hypothetical protein